MRASGLLGLVVALVVGGSALAAPYPQETFWKANISAALDAKAKGDRSSAETSLRVALARARRYLGPTYRATSLFELGVLLRESGRPQDALPCLEEAWSIAGVHSRATAADRARVAMELAGAYGNVGRWGDAAPILERVASDADALAGAQAKDLADLVAWCVGPVRAAVGEAAADRLAAAIPKLRAASARVAPERDAGPTPELLEAARRREPEACLALSEYYAYGQGVKPDQKRAFALIRTAAEQGHTVAEFELGERLLDGLGARKNPAEASRWTRRAAEKGLAPAEVTLGWMFRYGTGVPQDPAEAVRWFRKAVEQDDAMGEVNLSAMYYLGLGVPKDLREADRLCRKAALQGEPACIWNVALSAERGDLGAPDHAEAWAWFDVLARIPNEAHPFAQAKWHRDDVETRMTAEQAADARARAERYYAAILESGNAP